MCAHTHQRQHDADWQESENKQECIQALEESIDAELK
jgi:hypothetical protein